MPLDINAAPSGPVSAGAPVDRAAIVSAVEKYLASRGIGVSAPAAAAHSCSCGTTQSSVTSNAVSNVAAEVVDKFLTARGVTSPRGGYGWLNKPAPEAPQPEPAKPAPPVVDFVCEADVRAAIKEQRKIYIGPKTIVTPSARDLAGPSDILVLA
jgi:hypothetical protein